MLTREDKLLQDAYRLQSAIKQFLELIKKNSEDIDQNDIQKFKIYCNTNANKGKGKLKDDKEGKAYDRNTLVPKYSAINSYIRYLDKPEEWINKRRLKVHKIKTKPDKRKQR